MKTTLPITLISAFAAIIIISSCSRKNYAYSYFEQQTVNHKMIAVLPAEIIITGKQPKNLTAQQIDSIEEDESKAFQVSLQNSILRHANSNRYYMYVGMQDISATLSLLQQNNIGIRDSWKMDSKSLAKLLGVDAVVRMQVTKRRYLSDYASYGVGVAEQILWNTGVGGRVPLPNNAAKTNDIAVSCNLISDNITLWNDYYKAASDWNNPANVIIDNITNRFGSNFPYKRRR